MMKVFALVLAGFVFGHEMHEMGHAMSEHHDGTPRMAHVEERDE
jgi:hypothetical protein